MTVVLLTMLGLACGFIGVILLLGGLGVRAQARKLRELEGDLLSLEERHTREIKRRAGLQSQQGKDNMAEAQQIVDQLQLNPIRKRARLPGRTIFNGD